MSFRIRPDADFTEEFRRIASKQLKHAVATLEERPEGTHEAIHTFRKDMKRLRSLYRLVAKEAPDFQKRENARLREVTRSLSAVRDATALIGTARHLGSAARNETQARALGRVADSLSARRDWLAEAEGDLEERLLETAAALRESISELDEVSFAGPRKSARMLAKGWARTTRKARKALSACHTEGRAENFHDLRKRAQDYRANHRLMSAAWPAALKAKREETKKLVDVLGHVHDLAVLSQVVQDEPQLFADRDDLEHLHSAMEFCDQRDRQEAMRLAKAVFADEPAEEAWRIELLWMAARR
ncbi:MAG: CHAD domain-containing protein [Shinella sp.]|jgi:CHAD domain-containing protein|nr:CHAD domain-containing protein [Shinella sp.]